MWIRIGYQQSNPHDVYYLQTPSAFADVRIPKDRPSFSHARSFADLSDGDLRLLARQRGFVGHTTIDGDVATWHHELDFQPDTAADIGRLEQIDAWRMFEHGLDESYIEAWRSVSRGDGRFVVVRVEQPDGRLDRLLVVVGDYFTYARNRAKDLPPAESLDSLIASTHPTRDQLVNYLDCELSTGRVRSGRVAWEIQHSTLPWREGRHLEFADSLVATGNGATLTPRHRSAGRWSVPVNTLPPGELSALLRGAP